MRGVETEPITLTVKLLHIGDQEENPFKTHWHELTSPIVLACDLANNVVLTKDPIELHATNKYFIKYKGVAEMALQKRWRLGLYKLLSTERVIGTVKGGDQIGTVARYEFEQHCIGIIVVVSRWRYSV